MTILIFGKSGQVGRALATLLGDKAYHAGRSEADFMHPECFASLIDRVQPTAIINAVAYTQVDKAESEEDVAHQVNAIAPAELARLAKERNIPFVHYSTDYVFDGRGETPFMESDNTAPLNAYGRTKRDGEAAIEAIGGAYLIFRTSWVFDAYSKNFFTTMLKLGADRSELSIVADQIGAPSYAPHLAMATMEALVTATHQPAFPSGHGFPSGIYHMCNAGETSWHGFATAIFDVARHAGIPLMVERCYPILSHDYPTPATRPLNSRLSGTKLTNILGVTLPDWREGVAVAMHELAI